MSERRLRFDAAIVGMLDTIRDASDPHYPEWSPYRGRIAGQPAWWARYVMREARKLGLLKEDDDDDQARGRTQADSRRQDLARHVHS